MTCVTDQETADDPRRYNKQTKNTSVIIFYLYFIIIDFTTVCVFFLYVCNHLCG